jgi:hypothetical protein
VGSKGRQLQGAEAQGRAAGGVGLGQDGEDLVGTTVDEMEPVEGEGGPGTIPDQPLKAFAVGGLDPDAGIETEPRRP